MSGFYNNIKYNIAHLKRTSHPHVLSPSYDVEKMFLRRLSKTRSILALE